jgi:hypothetical protein
MLVEMEPRFTLSFIDIIFGDQGLTEHILIDLDIVSTCVLHGNYHHLINEVWPHALRTFCPNMNTTSYSLLSTKQVAVYSLLPMKMIL